MVHTVVAHGDRPTSSAKGRSPSCDNAEAQGRGVRTATVSPRVNERDPGRVLSEVAWGNWRTSGGMRKDLLFLRQGTPPRGDQLGLSGVPWTGTDARKAGRSTRSTGGRRLPELEEKSGGDALQTGTSLTHNFLKTEYDPRKRRRAG